MSEDLRFVAELSLVLTVVGLQMMVAHVVTKAREPVIVATGIGSMLAVGAVVASAHLF